MIRDNLKGQRLVALFLLGVLLLNYPLVSLFAGMAEIAGVPLEAWFYILGVVAVVPIWLLIQRQELVETVLLWLAPALFAAMIGYINNMPEAMAIADVAISRAGAMATAELSPSPRDNAANRPPIFLGNRAMPLFRAAGPLSVMNLKWRKSLVSMNCGRIILPRT